jgi:hypothetical protein
VQTNRHARRDALLTTLSSLALVVLFVPTLATTSSEKMKPEEVVAKHLESIGAADALAAAKSRVMTGTVEASIRLVNTPVQVSGPAQLASDGNKVLLAMVFNSSNYPYEKVGFDGQKVTTATLATGGRTPLGNFLGSQDAILKSGLLGGSLSSAWLLLNYDPHKSKLSYAGTDKLDGKPVHKLKFNPGSSGLLVNLYFDVETFRHVRTTYEYTLPAPQGAIATESASQKDSRYKLVEDFSDFQTTGKLTLPHAYKLQLIVELPVKTQTFEWAISFSQIALDQTIDPEAFNVARSK